MRRPVAAFLGLFLALALGCALPLVMTGGTTSTSSVRRVTTTTGLWGPLLTPAPVTVPTSVPPVAPLSSVATTTTPTTLPISPPSTTVPPSPPVPPAPTPTGEAPTTEPPAPSQPVSSAPATSGSDYDAWTRVSVCENGAPGWNPPQGSAYPDSLGISAANWYANGGGSDLSPAAQIAVAERIQSNPPDQNGCDPGGW